MSFVTTILKWFHENGRVLPWRETTDPYAIWLSEIILQQTRIEQGRPYWESFMQRWPQVENLAAASEDEVLREWQGLGYYSRARNLHTAAKQVVALGGFPKTIEGLRALKGVGDYTAAAIGSIAFGLPVAVVLLAQELIEEVPVRHSQPISHISPMSLTNPISAYNQAMMDFGAVQCTPQRPNCLFCPLQESCIALQEGRVDELPVKQKTLKVKERHLTYIYIRYRNMTAIHRRPAGDIWQGLYEPWITDEVPAGSVLLRSGVKHVLTHRILYADFWLWEPQKRPSLPDDYFWIKEKDIDQYGVPRLVEILLEAL